jgi:hypothetical protein
MTCGIRYAATAIPATASVRSQRQLVVQRRAGLEVRRNIAGLVGCPIPIRRPLLRHRSSSGVNAPTDVQRSPGLHWAFRQDSTKITATLNLPPDAGWWTTQAVLGTKVVFVVAGRR